MLNKTRIRVWLDIGCSAVRIGVVEEKPNATPSFIVLAREAFEPQARLIDHPAMVAQAIKRLRERVETEHRLVFNSAYVGLCGDFVENNVQHEPLVGSRGAVKAKDLSALLQKVREQTADVLQVDVLGLAVRGENGWQTVHLAQDEAQHTEVEVWWQLWRARPEGKRLMQEILHLSEVGSVDGYYAQATMLAQSALPTSLMNARQVLVIDLGASGSEQVLVKNGAVVFRSHLATGGVALSQALAHQLKIAYAEAEAGKCQGQWSDLLDKLYAERIFQPLKSALIQARGQLALDAVVLAGGGASALAVQSAERVFGCAVHQASVEAHWQACVPEDWWQNAPKEDYLPLLGLYRYWYQQARDYEPEPREGLFKALKQWFKKISD